MCTTDRHDGSCATCETDEWVDLTPTQRMQARLAAFNRGTREAAAEFAARITPTFKENPMTSDIKQARTHLDEVYGSEGSEKYLTRCASTATAHALLAIYDLLDERLPKPKPIDPDLAARNLDALKHELETPMREHGECCGPAPADDLPGEPVEPGDLRAGDKVAFTWEGKRHTCNLVSHRLSDSVLRSNAPDPSGYHPNVVDQDREWYGGISDVRLIERAPREDVDPDEALWTNDAQVDDDPDLESVVRAQLDGHGVECHGTVRITSARIARAAREHIEAEWKPYILREQMAREKAQDRVAKAEAERDEALARCERVSQRADSMEAERAFWKAKHGTALANQEAADEALGEELARSRALEAKHAALRAAVDKAWDDAKRGGWSRNRMESILRSDAARDPQPEPDTVTLRRDDVIALAEVWERQYVYETEIGARVRAALGWGDEA